MTTKLISMNVGVILEVEVDGKVRKLQFSVTCPRGEEQPMEAIYTVKRFVDDVFGYSIEHREVPIAKPKRLKPRRTISQAEYNRRIAELGK